MSKLVIEIDMNGPTFKNWMRGHELARLFFDVRVGIELDKREGEFLSATDTPCGTWKVIE